MSSANKGGWSALYEVQERKRAEREARKISPATQAGHDFKAGQALQAEHASVAGPAKVPLKALPEAGHASVAGPAIETGHEAPAPDLLASLPSVAGYLKLTNQIVDHLLPQLEPYEQIVYLQLYRLSHGNGKPFCLISMPKLARRTKISERSLWRAVAELGRKGLVKKHSSVHGRGKEQGISFWVAAPAGHARGASHARQAGHARQADNKIKALKENISKGEIHRLTPEEITEHASIIREVLEGGYTIEQAKAQFAGSFHEEDWRVVIEEAQKVRDANRRH